MLGEGIWVYTTTTGVLTFSPLSGFTGNPTPMIYTLTEIATGLSDIATVRVEYNVGLKALPDGVIVITHYGATVIDVLKNDIFNSSIEIKIIEEAKYGTLEVVIESDGRPIILYSPFADINNVPDSFRYSITDTNNNVSEATVKLDVQCASSQTSDGDAFSGVMLFVMMLLTMMIGLYAIKREEKRSV